MEKEIIKKDGKLISHSNFTNYEKLKKSFKWESLNKYCEDLKFDEEVNMAQVCIDDNAIKSKVKNKISLKVIKKSGVIELYNFQDLKKLTNQFANVLTNLGIQEKDSIFCITPRCIELFISCFGILKTKAIFCPIFSAFGPGPIYERMKIASPKLLICTESIYKKKIIKIEQDISFIENIILIPDENKKIKSENIYWFDELLSDQSQEYTISKTMGSDPAIMHFTSGTTGTPKAAIHGHSAVFGHAFSAKVALDMQPSDIYWCTADPGWVTGTSYGIIAPLVNRTQNLIVETEFDAYQWLQILNEHKVSVWYTSPTALRMLMGSKLSKLLPIKLKNLRIIASVGEPLNAETIRWSLKNFNLPIHDNWWQTETGSIIISNFLSMDIRPGSMGKPLPGVEVELVELDRNGKVKVLESSNQTGIIAIKKGWPSMFQTYLGEEKRYLDSFHNNYYLSGDLAYKDKDGYFWFVSRMDDLIKTAGHLVGPFEIESVLMEHPLVLEAAIIGIPDATYGQLIKAFVVLKLDDGRNEKNKSDILSFCRTKLGSSISPKEIELVKDLPKTRSGKIMRRLLRCKELGVSFGDLSTLLNPENFS